MVRAHAALLIAATAIILATGCASSGAHRSTTTLPGARIDRLENFYVQRQPDDSRDIHVEIRDILTELGFSAAAGEGPPESGEYGAWVTYIDRYMWDMTMYCLQLTIYVRDPATGYIVGTGSSYRPSMVRKTPAGHAKLILIDLLQVELQE